MKYFTVTVCACVVSMGWGRERGGWQAAGGIQVSTQQPARSHDKMISMFGTPDTVIAQARSLRILRRGLRGQRVVQVRRSLCR